MKVVIADTSPVNYLVQIGEIDLLPRLYGTIVIPTEVFLELSDSGAPGTVYEWISQRPAWLEIRPTAGLATSSRLFDKVSRILVEKRGEDSFRNLVTYQEITVRRADIFSERRAALAA